MVSGMINRCHLGILGLWVCALAPLMKSVMPPAAVPLNWIRVFALRRIAERLVSVSLIMDH
jgi:hypothetical protein